ncbi:unnamed protein product [Clonostachys byssicola]|uniref:Uncharacterized protein n=1 Tax=Clonostachys byssicola TaxID=160290 RepID=A0A9N9UP03_9HYPO|nr:unnamed protein product [Clonostachys byssicola]
MSVELNAIVVRDFHGALERPGKRQRHFDSPVLLDDEEENENKRQKKDKEDHEDQSHGHSGSENMSQEEGEAMGDNRHNPASNDRTDAIEAKLEKLMLGHEKLKLNICKVNFDHEKVKLDIDKVKLDNEKLKFVIDKVNLNNEKLERDIDKANLDNEKLKRELEILKLDYKTYKEEINVILQDLLGIVAQLVRATKWLFGRVRATTKLADGAATIVKSLWKWLRGEEAKPRPTRLPAVVSVASFANPDANPEYWVG